MLSKMKKLNWGRIVTLVVVFLVGLFTPLLYVVLALGDIEVINDIQKTLLVLFGSRFITILTTCLVKCFKTLENPKEDIYNIYVSCLISYIIVFGCLLLKTSDFGFLTIIFLLMFDFVNEYMSLTCFKITDLKNSLINFFKSRENYILIFISLIIILFLVLEILMA